MPHTAIGLLMYKQTDANAVEVSEQVQEEIKEAGKRICIARIEVRDCTGLIRFYIKSSRSGKS